MRIAVLGANGRMGRAVTRLVIEGEGLELGGASTEPGHASVGADAAALAGLEPAGIRLTGEPAAAVSGCRVAVDFSAPAATAAHARACVEAGCGLVVGTTGLGEAELEALRAAAARIPVVYARNMSVGITVLTELSRLATRLLGEGFDIEITEAHHRHKKDAPSGTALQLGEAVAEAAGHALDDVAVYARERTGPEREGGSIGFAVIRAGSIVGDHTVLFAGAEERLELTHRASDRALFARGAVRAARWLADRPPGMYSMRDVLGLA